jgi:hypothetical protein
LLGLADSGKTTLLIQFFGRLKSGQGKLLSRGAPENLARIEAGLMRLNQGLPVEHTPVGAEFTQALPAQSEARLPIEIELPDYSGEDLRRMVQERQLTTRWRELARECDHWILLIRLTQQARRPDVLNNPVGALAMKAWNDKDADPDQLPLDMWAVELLQMLRYARAEIGAVSTRTRLTLVLSCWDELEDTEGQTPSDLARKHLALLDSYCRVHWSEDEYDVIGLSSQGQALDTTRPSEQFIDKGPEQMGWLVLPDGSKEPDLTLIASLD